MVELNRNYLVKLFGTENKLQALSYINLSGRGITKIDPNTFKGLIGVERIDLDKNGIEKIDGRIFEGLSNLKELFLERNKLKQIDLSGFKGIIHLARLELQNNEISEIKGSLLEVIPNLEAIDLSNNKLKQVDENTFKGLTKLWRIALAYNDIEVISEKLLDRITNLKELYLTGNKLKTIDPKTFKNLVNLELLVLSNNEIEKIDGKLFEGLSSLKEIHLNNNKLTNIESTLFKGLGKLELISLGDNELVEIDPTAFEGLSSLRALNLYSNKLKKIDRKCFESLAYIHVIQLFDNELKALSYIHYIACLNYGTKVNEPKLREYGVIRDWDAFLRQFPVTQTQSENKTANQSKSLSKNQSQDKNQNNNQNQNQEKSKNQSQGQSKIQDKNQGKNQIQNQSTNQSKSQNQDQDKNQSNNQNQNQSQSQNQDQSKSKIKNQNQDKNQSQNQSKNQNQSRNKNQGNNQNQNQDQSQIQNETKNQSQDKNQSQNQGQSINQNSNPKSLINDYYDSLISEVNSYSDELNNYKDEDILKNMPKPEDQIQSDSDSIEIEGFKNPYRPEYEKYKNDLAINVALEPGKIREYLSLVQSKAIEVINKAKEETLNRYEVNKDKYKSDPKHFTDEKAEEMRRELFKEKFCFVIRVGTYKLFTIVTDFYVDFNSIQEIKFLLGNLTYSFNVNNFLANLIAYYISILCNSHVNEVISIKKETLQKFQHVNIICTEFRGKIDCNFRVPCEFLNLSQLKSIDIYFRELSAYNKIINLSALKNLEYLVIVNGRVDKETVKGLDKLVKLQMENCNDFNNSFMLCDLSHLKILDIALYPDFSPLFKFRMNENFFNPFKNLKMLRLFVSCELSNLDFLKNKSLSQLEYLSLNGCQVVDVKRGSFSKLKSLVSLDMSESLLTETSSGELDIFLAIENLGEGKEIELKKDVFEGLGSLKTLNLSSNSIEKIHPEVFKHTPKLEHLKIGGNRCKLGKSLISHLKHLKTIEVFKDDVNRKKIDLTLMDALKQANIEIIIKEISNDSY